MTTEEKKDAIKHHVIDMINESGRAMIDKIDSALNCGALDIDSWDKDDKPMIIPHVVISALLQREINQHSGKGTSYEKKVKKELKNLSYFI